MIYKNIYRFTGKFIKLDNCTFTHSKNILDKFLCSSKFYSHFHVNVHDKTDISLFHSYSTILQHRILNTLNIWSIHRHLHTHSHRHSAHLHLWHSHRHSTHLHLRHTTHRHSTHLHLWHTTHRHSTAHLHSTSWLLHTTH